MKTNLRNGFMALNIIGSLALSMPISASANPLSFAPNGVDNAGKIKCEIPVTALGKTLLRNGKAIIADRVITIKAGNEISESPRTVLIGSVLRTDANVSSDPPNITGLALFLLGDMASQIDDGTTTDTIFCKEKDKHIDGRILGIQDDAISVQGVNGQAQKVPINSILYIRSPRVFVFKISLKSKQPLQKDSEFQAESTEVSFRPTAQARTLSGSVIPASARNKEDDTTSTMTGLTGLGNRGTGVGAMNSINPAASSAAGDPRNDYFDAEEKERFGTVKTKWGNQVITVPPGYLE